MTLEQQLPHDQLCYGSDSLRLMDPHSATAAAGGRDELLNWKVVASMCQVVPSRSLFALTVQFINGTPGESNTV